MKSAAISRLACPHHMDHLAPLCSVLTAPFVSSDEDELLQLKEFYPDVKGIYVPENDAGPKYLTEHFSLLMHSFPWPKKLIEKHVFASGKKVRSLFSPHGYSDKSFFKGSWSDYKLNDLTLIYGKKMREILEKEGIDPSSFIEMGNLRYSYYLENQTFFDERFFQKFLQKKTTNLPTLLYAPSWKIGYDPSSLYQSKRLLEKLSEHFFIFIKIHPWQEKDRIAHLYAFISSLENHPHIQFIENFPLIYPILEKTDCYLGDVSSIGYDFLTYNRPMFFLNTNGFPEDHPGLSLQKLGETLSLNEINASVKKILSYKKTETKMEEERLICYDQTFGKNERFFKKKQQLLQSLYDLI